MSQKSSMGLNAMNYGLYFGLIMLVYSMISIFTTDIENLTPAKSIMQAVIVFAIFFIGIAVCQVMYRKKAKGNFMEYSEAFTFGILLVIFASLISAVFQFAFTKWIDPEYLSKSYDAAREMILNRLYSANASQEMIENYMKKFYEKGVPTPAKAAFQVIISYFVIGLIVSLITSTFTRKKEQPFQ